MPKVPCIKNALAQNIINYTTTQPMESSIVTHTYVQFSISWIHRLALRGDFEKLLSYVEKINNKIGIETSPPYPKAIWSEVLHGFFMIELGATLKMSSIVLESHKNITRLITSHTELLIWKRRLLQGGCQIGTLDTLPQDVLWYISEILSN